MKSKVCLVRCPAITLPYPPDLGLGYVSAALKRAGHVTRVMDLNWDLYLQAEPDVREAWLWTGDTPEMIAWVGKRTFEDFLPLVTKRVEKVLDDGFRIFGFSIWESNRANSLKMIDLIKKRDPRAVIIIGGPDCMPRWEAGNFIARPGVDAVVLGEGEETVVDLLASLDRSGRLEPCAGAYVWDGKAAIRGAQRPSLDPALAPYPDYSDYDVSNLDGRLAIAFNRGCVRRCKFCSVPGYIPDFRWRPAENIFNEMIFQSARYGTSDFYEFSPATNSNLKELLKLCEMISASKLDINWNGFAIFNPAMTLEVIEKMRAGGCRMLSFGLESGSQKILDAMEKGFKVADAERILRDMRRAGINAGVGMMVGYPGETEDDFQQTSDFIKRNAGNIGFVGSVSATSIDNPYARISSEPGFDGVLARHALEEPVREERRRRLQALAADLGLYKRMHSAEHRYLDPIP